MIKFCKYFFGNLAIWVCNFIIAYIPFHFIRLAYYRYVMGYKIGSKSSIHLGCRFNCIGRFEMKDHSTVNQYCHLDNRGGIVIGNNVSISPGVSLVTADHDINHEQFAGRIAPIYIEDYVFIGYRAVVLKNCTLKEGSSLGAMSLLVKSTELYGIYFGVPATLVKYRNKVLRYRADYKRLFH